MDHQLDSIFSSLDHPQIYLLTPKQSARRKKQNWARKMRHNPTRAEAKLWKHLRKAKICGKQFCSQYVLRGFIADFACVDLKLIVEVDGPSHEIRKKYDATRTKVFNERGWIVIRFTNDEVMNHIRAVKNKIRSVVSQLCA